ncbi:MAG: hypothetical protein A3D13_03300 [Planctomycetes bacterium RIFCSPHIGHO2_02_FULL_40_12]|nr:MAG: hypothetical protein A3D13_03300 [Planctomycetes bacterium RIFCSPHIGHO2_02_FULL_40_12]
MGKAGGAFGSYTHSINAPKYIFPARIGTGGDTMEHVFKMEMTPLGSFNLLEHLVEDTEGMRACQDYGRSLSNKLGS